MQEKRTTLARWLSNAGYETIEPMEFYRHMFPVGELAEYTTTPRAEEANQEWKYNAILLRNTNPVAFLDVQMALSSRIQNINREVNQRVHEHHQHHRR